MTESRRRGVCPGLSAPMPTGDGLLARLLPAGPVALDAMAAFCVAARRHGNGIIEVTARGSLQVRGLTLDSAPLFAADVAELEIAVQEGVPVIAGFDDGAADLLATQLRGAIATAQLALSPKVSIVVDGNGPLHLDGLPADVRLRVVGPDPESQSSALRFYLGLGSRACDQGSASERERAAASGDAPGTTWLGTVARKDAPRAVIDSLSIIAARGPAARAADVLTRESVGEFHAITAVAPAAAPPPRVPAEMIGLHAMRDGTMALGVGLVFGHAHVDALGELIRIAVRRGVRAVRPMPDRAILLTGVSMLNTRGLIAAVERLGFVVHADDPRRRIAACPGAPACASALIPARVLASTLAPVLASLMPPGRNGVAVHISGCPKGCAHPAPAALTLVGAPQGLGVIREGAARDAPLRYLDPARLSDEASNLMRGAMEARHG
jgi:precorrin-3B synthase